MLATLSDDGDWVPFQLTVDFKPNIPGQFLFDISTSCIYVYVLRFLFLLAYTEAAERITQSKGLVFCLNDEPGVYMLR